MEIVTETYSHRTKENGEFLVFSQVFSRAHEAGDLQRTVVMELVIRCALT